MVVIGELRRRRGKAEDAIRLIGFALDQPAMLDYYRVQDEQTLEALEKEVEADRFAAVLEQ